MKNIRRLLAPALILVAVPAFGYNSYIEKSRSLNEGGTETEVAIDYFAPTSIVDESGEASSLTATNKVVHINADLIYRYGLTPDFQVTGGLRARNVQTSFIFSDDGNQYNISKTGLENFNLGFRWSSGYEGSSQYALEGYYAQKMFTNTELNDETFLTDSSLGDDTREYAIGFTYTIKTSSDNLYEARMLYRSPAEYLSTEVFSEVQLTLRWERFALYGGVENVYSLDSSPYANEIDTKPSFRTDPSELYNSIDRSWTAPYLGAALALGPRWRIETRYTQVFTGNSTDIGPRILVSLAKRTEEKKEFQKRDQKFKEYRLEGNVTKISKSRKLAIVNKGQKDDLKVGMRVDFYYFDYVGGNELIARGVVIKSQVSRAVVQIKKRYGRRRVQEGTVIRAGEIRD